MTQWPSRHHMFSRSRYAFFFIFVVACAELPQTLQELSIAIPFYQYCLQLKYISVFIYHYVLDSWTIWVQIS